MMNDERGTMNQKHTIFYSSLITHHSFFILPIPVNSFRPVRRQLAWDNSPRSCYTAPSPDAMPNLSLHPSAAAQSAPDLAGEIARLEALLAERRAELISLQEQMREFRACYTRVVGSRLAELAEVERSIREAEARLLGLEGGSDGGEEEPGAGAVPGNSTTPPVRTSLRNLFWSVARLFHPDHAADEQEARRRHSIMAEASRAYREGDAESLSTLLADEGLQFYCTTARGAEDPEDLAGRLLNLKEELRTVEFGLKRIRQDGLYHLKLKADAEAARGRDALAEMASGVERKIKKARYRLAHLT